MSRKKKRGKRKKKAKQVPSLSNLERQTLQNTIESLENKIKWRKDLNQILKDQITQYEEVNEMELRDKKDAVLCLEEAIEDQRLVFEKIKAAIPDEIKIRKETEENYSLELASKLKLINEEKDSYDAKLQAHRETLAELESYDVSDVDEKISEVEKSLKFLEANNTNKERIFETTLQQFIESDMQDVFLKKTAEYQVTKENGLLTKPKPESFRVPRLLQLCLIMAITLVVLYIFVLTDQRYITSSPLQEWDIKKFFQNALPDMPWGSSKEERHLILLWTPFFAKKDWLPSTETLQCKVDNCDVTSDRSRIKDSSVVIIHWRDINPNDLPKFSTRDMFLNKCPVLALFNKEAPPHTYAHTLEKIKNKISWTVTYRRDSDVFAPYGNLLPRTEEVNVTDIKLNRSSVCWLVSNCNTPSKREQYVKELKQYIPVEVYGGCGNSSCKERLAIDCYRKLSDRCKFYLSFENSMCKDYVTEKLYNALMMGMLPVVLGGNAYAAHLPNQSFIDVRDFSSPKALADYLIQLQKDDAKYLSYFQWKRKYTVQDASYRWLCDMCEKLNNTDLSLVRPSKDVSRWWYDTAECTSIR